jgi:phosphoserine phosphatase
MRDGKGTGMLTKSDEEGICTGPDKLREMKKLVERRGGQNEDIITVYIGDSNTDLPCLLYADIGIIIGDGKSVIDTCERVGVIVESGGVISVEGVQKVKDDRDLKLYHFGGWDSIIKSGLLD